MKHLTQVEYKTMSDGLEIGERKILGDSYWNERTHETRVVNSIVEKVENNIYSVLICFNNGDEEQVFHPNITRIFRELQNGN